MRPVRALSTLAALALASPAVAATFSVDTTADTLDAVPGDGTCADAGGDCSLRAAVQEANAAATTTTVWLSPGATYVLTLAGRGEDAAATGDLDVLGSLRIVANEALIDAATLDRAFDVQPGASLTVASLAITRGSVDAESGGAYRSRGELRVHASLVTDSVATGAGASGGAIFNDAGYLEVFGTWLLDNTAARAGGAIEANAGTTVIVDARLHRNHTGAAPGNGGAVHLTGAGDVTLRNTRVIGNSASSEGGGLWNSSTGHMVVEGCTILRNHADGAAADNGGGGLFNDGGTLLVLDSSVRDNTASVGSGSGGGIFDNAGQLYVFDTDLRGNSAARAGGGIELLASDAVLDRVTLDANSTGPTPGNGGGLHLTGAGDVVVSRSTVTGNVASAEGGGLWNSATGTMRVQDTRVLANTASGAAADQGGGGLFNDGGTMFVTRCTVDANVADGAAGSGGGLFNNLGLATVRASSFDDNTASRAGGGVEANVGTTRLRNVVLSHNTTGPSPGNGGGLHLTGAGLVEVDGGRVTTNDATNEGGGLWNSATGTMLVTGTSIVGNTSPEGPEVFNTGGTFLIDGAPVPVGP